MQPETGFSVFDGYEGHPVYLCDNGKEYHMGAILSDDVKKNHLPFIKSNIGKMSQREIARRLNIGKTTVNRWSSEIGFSPIKHTVNEDFFKHWSDDMAYILGYVATDGNINWNPAKSYRALTITACEKDSGHLECVRKLIKSTKPLLYSNKTKSYRLIANSEKICGDLMGFGITNNKSLTIKFPNIPKCFLPHFIRGVVDGDGTIRYNDRKRSPYFDITIYSGSRDFCEGLVKSVKTLGIDGHVRKVHKHLFVVQYCCTRGMKLAKIIYKGSNIRLERKFQKYGMALSAKGGGQL